MITKTNEQTENETNNVELSTEIIIKKRHPIKKLYKKIKRKINRCILIIANRIMILIFPLDEKRVFFLSDVREELGGNLKCLYDIIPDDKYNKVTSMKADRRKVRSIKEKIRLAYNLSIAKYILLEDLSKSTAYIKIRKGQELIQLWHGAGAYKKFGFSRVNSDLEMKKIHQGYKKYTKAITSGEEIRQCYAEAFNIDINKVQATGFPRTDIFFDKDYIENKRKIMTEKYPFIKNKKVIVFAPTYRGEAFTAGSHSATYDFSRLDLDKIYENLKDEYVFIFKWHPALYNNMLLGKIEGYDLSKYNNFYYDLSPERDINDLLLVTDILITDYSSVIFDYLFTNKPIIYFAYDIDEYANGRGLYFPFKEYVYGKIALDDDELISAIKAEDMQETKRKKFTKKFLNACDGHSTQKTYEWIFENKLNSCENNIIMEEEDCKLNT